MSDKNIKKQPLPALSKPDFRLKKAVEAIAIRPTRGRITMLVRKSFNVLLHQAMEQGTDKEVYKIRLAELIANVSPDSNDYETFKTYLRKMNATQVEWHSTSDGGAENWGVSSLLAEAEVINSKKDGYVLEYSFAPKIKKRLLDPEVYTHIIFRFQSVLRSNASLALYEICSRYATNPSNLTMRHPWQWWRPVLTGTPDQEAEGEYGEYKYFKRDVLKPALNEVNKLTDLDVELIEHKIGRRVDEVQFRVTAKAQTNLDLGQGPLIDSSLLQRIVGLGFRPDAAREIYTEFEESLIRACLEKTEDRIKNVSLGPLTSAVAYFRTLLKDKNNIPQLTLPKSKLKEENPDEVKKKLRDAYTNHQRATAQEMFNEANEDEQRRWLDQFELQYLPNNAQVAKAYAKNGIEGKIAQMAFFTWLATSTWGGEPSESDLLTFAIESKRVG
ncbi:replication initiation protein [Methylovorus glucosotrophus]|uniref:Initiator RepB protein n=1 Tax=Methylovorus glucosotrophus (strain SIP3-4) TaxID=582744 RepID=C6XEL6_METGS|nr:replication initiation protein [Methylovorus glucosotrophus]ACT52073.1 initiator RepB protein [Methylovorus glucosotrophus SIP3-4]